MKKLLKGFLVALMVVSSTIGVNAQEPIVSTRVQEMINKMTNVEKMAQMIQADTRWITPAEVAEYKIGSILSGGGAAPETGNKLENWATAADSYQKAVIDNNGIPLLYGIDAVHGNNNLYGATIYPHNIGLAAAANDADLVNRIGEATASEVRAMGANWAFTPTLGVPHNERWGRTYETFGDDVKRVTDLGNAYANGIKNGDVLASAKHFLGEGLATNGTNQGNIEMSESDYQDLINANMDNPMVNELLTPYKEVINDGINTIMITYSSINGKKCHGNKDVVTTLLKGKLGFNGIVISDYNGLDQIENQATYIDKAVACINAGVDMLMVAEQDGNTPKWRTLYNGLKEAVEAGRISEDRLNDAVARILTAKEKLGLLDDPSKAFANKDDQAIFGGDKHRALAREAVSETLVLLKNDEISDGKTIMEALGDMDNIMVAGSAGDDIGKQCGGWTITWQGATGNTTQGTTIFSGLKAAMEAKGGVANYSANGVFTNSDKAVDAAVVVVGENPYAESDGDREAAQLKLSATDANTIKNIKNAHPDLPIVLVLTTGRPIALADYVQDDQIKGIVNAWLPGSEGAGVADVLIGDKDFVATNPITWTWYPQDITKKYSDPSTVLYPVGYGLTKAKKTGEFVAPEDPSTIDLAKTNGVVEAEDFVSKHDDITVSSDGKFIENFWQNRDISYKVNVPDKASYKLSVDAATANANIDFNFRIYVDDVLHFENASVLNSTGGWTTFKTVDLENEISLPEGIHTIKVVSLTKDVNIDRFKFTKSGEYVGPIIPEDVTNEGTGAMLQEGAVEVSMSSSEHSQDMAWYKGEFEISNKNATKDALDLRVADTSQQTTIVVNDQKTYQSVLGMGTSIEESTIHNLLKMTDENRQAFLRRLLDPVNGMGMSLMRVTIGTSDFTAQDFYTYYDNGNGTELNGKPDWYNTTGKGFSIQKDIDYGVIKVINEMQVIAKELGVENNLKFFASSWTPPGWMKLPTSKSNSFKDNDLLLKGGKLNDEHINDLAKYYVRYIEEYKKQGINIYAMTLQNEPLLEIDYPSCAMTGTQEAKLAKAIKAELAKSEILTDDEKNVKVWAFDHNFDGADNFMNDFFSEAGKDLNLDGIAFHPYGGNASTMGSFYDKYKDQLSVNLTERSVWGTNGANEIITWLRNGSESYNSWVTMLDSNIATHHWVDKPDPTLFVQDANNAQRYWATPEVYIMSQFTKYVKPGYVRIDTNNGSSSTVTNVAFKDPETGKIVMIVANRSGKDQKFKVVMGGTQFNAVLPEGNVATYIWDGNISQIEGLEVPGTFGADKCSSYEKLVINSDGTLGNLTSGATADYFIDVKEAGTYNVLINVATGNVNDKKIELKSGDTVIGSTVLRQFNTGDNKWTDYKQVAIQVNLEKGMQLLTLSVPDGSVNIKDLTFKKVNYSNDVPGKIDGRKYCDAVGVTVENDYVSDFDTTDWSKMDYVTYRLNVQKAGTYPLNLEYATNGNEGGFWIDLIKDGDTTQDPVAEGHKLPATSEFNTVKAMDVTFAKTGIYEIKFTPTMNGGFNLKSLSFGSYINVTSEELVEGELNKKAITVDLVDGEFVNDLDRNNWSIEGLPAGMDFDLEKVSNSRVVITLDGNELVDYDNDLTLTVKVDAIEIGDSGYGLSDTLIVRADNDDEALLDVGDLAFSAKTFDLTIEGGKFNQDLKVADLVLSEEIAEYITITDVKVNVDGTKATVTFDRKKTNYEDIAGAISVKSSSYTDGNIDLMANVKLIKTDTMPTPIIVGEVPVSLNENDAYRKNGTLVNGSRGDYVDFYLGVEEAGNYVITYRIKDDEAVNNALRLCGGLGLATDNLSGVSFGKYWGNAQGYAQMLNLKAGDQTLRFEVNNAGFELTDLKIQKLTDAVEINGTVGQTTIVTDDKVIDGSKEIGWGIEGSTTKNIGFGAAGAYQDYYVDVKEAGVYDLKVNYSHDCGGNTKAVIMTTGNSTTTTLGEVVLESTGGWSNWKDSDTIQVKLAAGKQFIRIYDDLDGFNYRNFQLTLKSTGDVTAPTITGKDAVIYVNDITDIKTLLNLVINDDVDGNLLDKAEITGEFDCTVAGTYTVTVTVSDAAGNSTSKEFTIRVVDYAKLIVDDNTVTVGDKFDPLAGVKAVDVDGTDITDKLVVVSNEVDTTKAGIYTVVYQVTDGLGNLVKIERTVEVKAKEAEVKPVDPEGQIPPKNDGNQQVIPGQVIDSAKTGDDMNIVGLITIFALTGLGCLLLGKRKFRKI